MGAAYKKLWNNDLHNNKIYIYIYKTSKFS
jgi:hypothetical protein